MSKRILVVDDHSDLRKAVRLLLTEDNHTVVEANNGAEALSLFAEGRFDLVMTDFNIPFMKGNELAARIRELAPQQPILMLTAYEKKAGPDNPVDVVLRKPFGFRMLRQTLTRLLDEPTYASSTTAVLGTEMQVRHDPASTVTPGSLR